MEIHKVCFTLVAVTLTVFSSVANGDEFAKAYTKIEKAKPNIYYKSFFKQIAGGREEKLACRIIDLPEIVFLVCKRLEPELGVPCLELIENEVRNLDTESDMQASTE